MDESQREVLLPAHALTSSPDGSNASGSRKGSVSSGELSWSAYDGDRDDEDEWMDEPVEQGPRAMAWDQLGRRTGLGVVREEVEA